MDHKTHKAVKNILHNELGVTNEAVIKLITDFINHKAKKQFDDFMKTNAFEYMVNKHIENAIKPMVSGMLQRKLSGITINVTVESENEITNPNAKP